MEGQASSGSIVFVFRRDRGTRLDLWHKRLGPDELLYGFPHFAVPGHATILIEGHDRPRGVKARVWHWLELIIAQKMGMGFNLPIFWEHRDTLSGARAIISTVDACGLPLAMLKRQGRLQAALIYISQGLSDRMERARGGDLLARWLTRKYRQFIGAADQVIVLGEGARRHALEEFALPQDRVQVLPFGVDTRFWRPGPAAEVEDWVLSVGSDPSRDYDTLLGAIGDFPLRIVSRHSIVPPPGVKVEVKSDFSDLELRDLYRRSRFVVIPLRDVAQPSGQSATLQAMACGKAVILSRTKGLWTPDSLRDGENVWLVPPGNVLALSEAIRTLYGSPSAAGKIGERARALVEGSFDSRTFGCQLAERVVTLLERSKIR